MKSFKEYLSEDLAYSNRFDLFNAVAGRIHLNNKAVQYMLPKEEKGKTFRHVTDLKGAEFLLTNQDKNIQISASDVAKICSGVETGGSVLLSVSGKPVVWMPSDAYTYLGERGIRWMEWASFNDKHDILSKDTMYIYYRMLAKILEKYPDMSEAMYSGGHFSAKELTEEQLDSLRTAYRGYGFYFAGISGERIANNLRIWMKANKARANKLLNEILKIQIKWLAGAESELKYDLGKLYNSLKQSKGDMRAQTKIQNQLSFTKYDEVVLDHVRVRYMYLKVAEKLTTYIRKHIELQSNNYHLMKEENELKQFFSKINVPFAFLDMNCSGKYWNDEILNNITDGEMPKKNAKGYYTSMGDVIKSKTLVSREVFNDYLDWLGIKAHKRSMGIQWYVRK